MNQISFNDKMPFPRAWATAFLAFAALFLLSGCGTPKPAVHLTGKIMVDGPMMITNGPPQDKVLWEYRTAAGAMRLGQFAYARELLDDALLTAGGVTQDKSAKLARSYFHPESTKAFIGEPYERVMAYFYRGILYWMDGEPDNARACFRSAALQDADIENRKYEADYVMLDYLDGLATTKLAGDGSDAFRRAEKEARVTQPPPYDPEANALFFVEFGPGPFKYASGQYREQLRFGVQPSPVSSARIDVAGATVMVGPFDDLHFQATTRGGRVMDHILANKAVFKSATDAAGTAALVGGTIAASQHNRTSQQVGIGLIAAGVMAKMVSAATTPAADIRAWDNLPRYLGFAALRVPPGQHLATIQFRDAAGKTLPTFAKQITFNVSSGPKDTVLFVSDQSSTPQTL
jgi:hypothetical protein